MKNSRLEILFNTLSSKDLRAFQKFICSPFFNQEQQLIDFFNFLVAYAKRFKGFPSKEKIAAHIYPKQVYKMSLIHI